MAEQIIPKIELTDDPLTNIIKMAPYLNEGDQRMVNKPCRKQDMDGTDGRHLHTDSI